MREACSFDRPEAGIAWISGRPGLSRLAPLDVDGIFGPLTKARMIELNRMLPQTPFQAVILIAAMMNAVESAIRNRVQELRRMMERCRQLAGQAKMTECLPNFNKINEQMGLIISNAVLQGFETAARRAQLLKGLAKSMGALMLLISEWAKCMACPFLQFF